MTETDELPRCHWCNLKNPLYVSYHDREWGTPTTDEHTLYEMFILETFQAGLSWECILNKRESFRRAFDGFIPETVAAYGEEKLQALLSDASIIRNRAKLRACVENTRVYLTIVAQYGTFYSYLLTYTHGETRYDSVSTVNEWSDALSRDLRRRGMRFVGSTTVYAFLQATGFINAHEAGCYLFRKNQEENI